MRAYKQLTSEGVLTMLKQRIEELEQQHWGLTMNLMQAKAIVAKAPETGTQRATSEAEAEQLERNVVALEAAIDVLVDQLAESEKSVSNRAHRRSNGDRAHENIN